MSDFESVVWQLVRTIPNLDDGAWHRLDPAVLGDDRAPMEAFLRAEGYEVESSRFVLGVQVMGFWFRKIVVQP